MLSENEQRQILTANNSALGKLARRWRNPKTGQTESNLQEAIWQMVSDYFGSPVRASGEEARMAQWASRVCLYALDIYDEDEERQLPEALGALLKLIQEPGSDIGDPEHEALAELERSMEETFNRDYGEECACGSPFVGLLKDYLRSSPMEKALLNYVMRRLANTTVPQLVPEIDVTRLQD